MTAGYAIFDCVRSEMRVVPTPTVSRTYFHTVNNHVHTVRFELSIDKTAHVFQLTTFDIMSGAVTAQEFDTPEQAQAAFDMDCVEWEDCGWETTFSLFSPDRCGQFWCTCIEEDFPQLAMCRPSKSFAHTYGTRSAR